MPKAYGYLKSLLENLQNIRENAGISQSSMEESLVLGPGWVDRFESGDSVPSIDMVLAMLFEAKASFQDLVQELPEPEAAAIDRLVVPERIGNDVCIHFLYSKHDAQYVLRDSTLEEFGEVVKVLRDGLASLANPHGRPGEAIKTDAVARAFLKAMALWPHANPSDVWWFLIYRVYCDPYNHPAEFARLDFTQSWKRTGGWALEEILKRHYGPFLKENGINLLIADGPTKRAWIEGLGLGIRVESDKIDLILTGDTDNGPRFFGIVNVKASFAERRTDDVPLSETLSQAGYLSPLWTMDCKSSPGPRPNNRGELGPVMGRRSAKRRDIEEEGSFTGCFSYNSNTVPSSMGLDPKNRIYICNFSDPDDVFTAFLIQHWQTFQTL